MATADGLDERTARRSSGPWYDVVKNTPRIVPWNDQVHESVRGKFAMA